MHRMFPFFAAGVVAGCQPWRPLWLLAAVWVAALLHLVLDLAKEFAWLWIADGALLALTCVVLWRWWPRGARPGLLIVLFLGLAWLPIAMALYTADSLHHAVNSASDRGTVAERVEGGVTRFSFSTYPRRLRYSAGVVPVQRLNVR